MRLANPARDRRVVSVDSSPGKRVRLVFDHLAALTDERGLLGPAGPGAGQPCYSVDDAALGLVVTSRETRPSPTVTRLHDHYLAFLMAAVDVGGGCRHRMDAAGSWCDEPGVGDWWGRTVWGLGTAAALSPNAGQRARALTGFRLAAQSRTAARRAMAFAALGAGAVLRARPGEPAARDLLSDAVEIVATPFVDAGWGWPEPRLLDSNAALPEALLVAGEALLDKAAMRRGLRMLGFLLRVEIRDHHLSVTPQAGRGPADRSPGFDQQPAQVAAIADACATAYRVTADPRWLTGINLAWRWFLGDNDANEPMLDRLTGAGYDGLQARGRTATAGAESTLAALSTAQQARRIQELR